MSSTELLEDVLMATPKDQDRRGHKDLLYQKHDAIIAIICDLEVFDPNQTLRQLFLDKDRGSTAAINVRREAMLLRARSKLDSSDQMDDEGSPNTEKLSVKEALYPVLRERSDARMAEFKEIHSKFTISAWAKLVKYADHDIADVIATLKESAVDLRKALEASSLEPPLNFEDNPASRFTRLSALECPPFRGAEQELDGETKADENIRPA